MGEEKERIKIAETAIALSVISIISVFISFFKESVIAYYYGASAYTDAYNISVDTPKIVFTFISMAISTVVIPIYTKTMVESGREKASYFFRNFTSIVFISYLTLTFVSEILASFIIKILAPGLNADISYLTIILFRITLPAIGLGLFCKINTGVLNSHKSFLLPSMAAILFNISMCFCVITFARKFGIYAATIGTVIGMILEVLFTSCLRRKYVSYKPVLNFHDKASIIALKMAGPAFVGMSATEINLIVDKIIASFFEAGSISVLNYASKLSSGMSTLFIASITTVIFPELTEYVANGKKEEAAKTYIFSIKTFILLLVPIIVGGIFLSREIMTLVYGRGKFDSTAISITVPVFVCYFISLLFIGLRQVGTDFLYSHGDSKEAMKNTIIGVCINIILDIVLSKIMGVTGLAFATTISIAVISILLMRAAKRKNKYINYKKCWLLLFQICIACCIMLIVEFMFKNWMVFHQFYNINNTKNTIFFTIGALLIGIIIYLLALFLLKVEEIYYILNIFKRKIKH